MAGFLSGLLKTVVETAVSSIEEATNNIKENKIEITVAENEESVIERLAVRLSDSANGALTPMTIEEFKERMSSIGFEVKELEPPQGLPKLNNRIILARKEWTSVDFVEEKDIDAALRSYAYREKVYKTEEGRTIISEEEGLRIFHKTADDSYLLFSRIENTILTVMVKKDKLTEDGVDILKALKGCGY